MKHIISFMVLCMLTVPAFSATGRVGMVKSPIASANRTSPSKMASMVVNTTNAIVTENLSDKSSVRVEDNTATIPPVPDVDRREKEKAACIQNNIGVGNTFVWASRYSNINDYSTMVEDTENPENNTCFVLVNLKSGDSRIDLGDIRGQYFEMGRNITCGAWVDSDMLEKRILDAKKKARTWATVGGAVGGAALGVGSMELFGNRLIDGAVEGQRYLERNDPIALRRSQLLVLKKEDPATYAKAVQELKSLQKACKEWEGAAEEKPDACANYDSLNIE